MADTDLDELDELRAELDEFAKPDNKAAHSPREERIIAGFEDIQRFVEEHGHAPRHGEDRDIFERLYAVRLDRIRKQPECRELVKGMDHQRLLDAIDDEQDTALDDLDDDALAAELSDFESEESDVTKLRHVKSNAEKRAAEEIANRTKCEDFDKFKPIFAAVEKELATGVRVSRVIRKDAGFLKANIKQGEFFILGGQTLYIAEVGEQIKAPNGQFDARLRVIYSNGTESNILLRSLQRAIYKDETSRSISEPTAGPLFSGQSDDTDTQSGTIYVLRSKSDLPFVADNRDVLHKIGVTGGKVESRIANAKHDATFLLAEVDVVATYDLYNINRTKLENLIHKFFAPARLDIEIEDRFGNPVKPREWFLVPLSAIDEMVELLKSGSLGEYQYDTSSAELKRVE